MSKTQHFQFNEASVIYNPESAGGFHGVVISGGSVTHKIVDPAESGCTPQQELATYREENPDCPERHFANCVTIRTPDGRELLAIPMNDDCRSVPINEVIRQNERRLSLEERVSDPTLMAAGFQEMDLHPDVKREIKKYAGIYRKGISETEIREIRPDLGTSGDQDVTRN